MLIQSFNSDKMYTNYLWGLFLFAFMTGYSNKYFLQVVKANALVLSFVILIGYLLFSTKMITGIQEKYFKNVPVYIIIVGDLLLHQLPLLYFGLPTAIIPIIASYLSISIYYIIFRPSIPDIYSSTITYLQYDSMFLRVLPSVIIFYILGLFIFRFINSK